MVLVGGLCCAAVLVVVCFSNADSGVRRRDACLTAAAFAVLLMPVAHLGLAFLGFVVNPRHYPGDYWAGQRDARLEAIVIALAMAVFVAGAGLIGGLSQPISRWRSAVGIAEVLVAAVFAGVELSVQLPALANATSRIGTIPM